MKKSMIHLLIALSMLPAFAQQQQQGGQNGGGATAQFDTYNEACETKNEASAKARQGTEAVGKTAAIPPVDSPLTTCEKLAYVAALNGSDQLVGADMKPTMDGKATCVKRGNYTLDYKSCKITRDLYNTVVGLEQAMFAAQTVMVTESNRKQSEEVAKKTAEGKGQEASMDAIKKRTEQASEMFKNQARLYGTAVAAMMVGVTNWRGQGGHGIKKVCKNSSVVNPKFKIKQGKDIQPGECEKIIEGSVVSYYSNEDAKVYFITQMGVFFKKAADAAAKAKINNEVAKKIGDIPKDEATNDVMWDKCQLDPNLPECKSRGPRAPGTGNFSGPGMSFNGNGAGQSFDMNAGGDSSFGEAGAETNLQTGEDKVSDVNNPFQDELNKANGILNPAGEATVTPQGGGAGGGAGGGPGGGGGGGSATLGDDLAGADGDANKENEIKTNALSGTYKSGAGGGGFAAVKGAKEENPFASLFGDKGEASEGGVEEDRSIASDSGEASGLFDKISRKYGEVHKDKRVESQNLE